MTVENGPGGQASLALLKSRQSGSAVDPFDLTGRLALATRGSKPPPST